MKSALKISGLSMALALSAKAQVYVVSLDTIPPPFFQDANYQLNVLTGGFGASLQLALNEAGDLAAINGTAGISHLWYQTTFGTPFDFSHATTNSPYFDLNHLESRGVISTNLNTPFYLSFWLGGNASSNEPQGLFGWSRLERTSTGLSLLDSAIEPSGKGIFVGTTTAVPEPSTYSLMGLGLAVVALVSRRRLRRCIVGSPAQ